MPASILQNLLTVGPLAAQATVTIAHQLRTELIGLIPNIITPIRNSPIVVVNADDTDITFRNDGADGETADFFVQATHTMQQGAPAGVIIANWWQGSSGSSGSDIFMGYFGNGELGDVVLAGDEVLTDDTHYNSLDTAGFNVEFTTAGPRLFVRNRLTVRAGSHLFETPAGGAIDAIVAGALLGGAGGSFGAGNPGVNSVYAVGGAGGAGGAGTGGAGGNGGTAAPFSPESHPKQLPEAVIMKGTGRNMGPGYDYYHGGGSGGGGGGDGAANDGGRGGAGGAIIVICAREIVIEAGGFIESNGGVGEDGTAADCGGGGGGGGGCVSLVYHVLSNAGTIQALGGAGGASGGGAGVAGVDGSAGQIFQLVV